MGGDVAHGLNDLAIIRAIGSLPLTDDPRVAAIEDRLMALLSTGSESLEECRCLE